MCTRIGVVLALYLAIGVSATFAQQSDPPVLSCLTDRPAIVEGQSVHVHAWFGNGLPRTPSGTPDQPISWATDAGPIETGGSVWDLSAIRAKSATVPTRVFATASIQSHGLTHSCTVEVIVARPAPLPPDRGPPEAKSLLASRRYLLSKEQEANGFGLYSYLLLAAPPRDVDSKARYLKAIEAFLSILPDVDAFLSKHVRAKELNVTYVPLTATPQESNSLEAMAKSVLDTYDYAAAQILLRKAGVESGEGPFLMSSLAPLQAEDGGALLQENLSGVAPELIWFWVRNFHYLAAQERSWTEVNLRRFGLQLRNVIAVGGKVSPAVFEALKTALQFKPKT